MFNPETLGVLTMQRRKDLMREAGRERLAREAIAAQEHPESYYQGALAGLGRQLSLLGVKFQKRLGNDEPASMQLAAESAGDE